MNKEDIKKYWCYEELKKRNYNIKIEEKKRQVKVSIISKYDCYTFTIKNYNYNLDTITISGYNVYDMQGYDITNYLEFTETIEDCVKGVLYHFYTRY